jgi:uracil-DNA glycosylase family 4
MVDPKKLRPPPPIPSGISLQALKPAADSCRACPIGDLATQAVVGRGGKSARLMLVGEQPGNEEDLKGEPFVGPAGKVLARMLQEAGVGKSSIYVTNAVKHFKWKPIDRPSKRRLHVSPSRG